MKQSFTSSSKRSSSYVDSSWLSLVPFSCDAMKIEKAFSPASSFSALKVTKRTLKQNAITDDRFRLQIRQKFAFV